MPEGLNSRYQQLQVVFLNWAMQLFSDRYSKLDFQLEKTAHESFKRAIFLFLSYLLFRIPWLLQVLAILKALTVIYLLLKSNYCRQRKWKVLFAGHLVCGKVHFGTNCLNRRGLHSLNELWEAIQMSHFSEACHSAHLFRGLSSASCLLRKEC